MSLLDYFRCMLFSKERKGRQSCATERIGGGCDSQKKIIEDDLLSGAAGKWVATTANGALTINQGLDQVRSEIAEYLGIDLHVVDSLVDRDAYDPACYEKVTQSDVTKMVVADNKNWVDNALFNIKRVRRKEKAEMAVQMVEQASEYAKGRLIDYGAGAGAASIYASAYGAKDLCIAEISQAQLDFIVWRLKKRGVQSLECWNLDDGSTPVKKYGAALVMDVFSVIAEPEELITRVSACLEPGGVIVANYRELSELQRSRFAYLIGASVDEIERSFVHAGFVKISSNELDGGLIAAWRKV